MLIQVSFLQLALNKNNNNKHAEYHDIFIPFKGQIYSKQGSHISLLLGTWTFSIIFPCLGEAKVPTVNSDLTNFVDVQRLHEHIPNMLTKNYVKAICSFHQEKVTFLSSYLLSPRKKNLVTRKIMLIQNISHAC